MSPAKEAFTAGVVITVFMAIATWSIFKAHERDTQRKRSIDNRVTCEINGDALVEDVRGNVVCVKALR